MAGLLADYNFQHQEAELMHEGTLLKAGTQHMFPLLPKKQGGSRYGVKFDIGNDFIMLSRVQGIWWSLIQGAGPAVGATVFRPMQVNRNITHTTLMLTHTKPRPTEPNPTHPVPIQPQPFSGQIAQILPQVRGHQVYEGQVSPSSPSTQRAWTEGQRWEIGLSRHGPIN